MKKTIIFFTIVAALSLAFSSCGYNDYSNPPEYTPDTLQVTHTIKELKSLYAKPGTIIKDSIVVGGKVISSDKDGNFYKAIVIQDETAGIEIKLNSYSLYNYYRPGQYVFLKCAGLQLGAYGNTVSIGAVPVDEKYENDFIPAPLGKVILKKGHLLPPVEPKVVTIDELSPDLTHILIKLENVQFLESEVNNELTYALDKKNTNRTLVNQDGDKLIVRTSGYAKFALQKLPAGSGDIIGILTYFNTTPQLTISSTDDVHFTNPRF